MKPSPPGFRSTRLTPGPRDVRSRPMSDISAILALVTGSLFGDIEAKAAVWQRPRRLLPCARPIRRLRRLPDGTADVAHMVEAFRLANANLQEIWSLVLPPHSLLLLKRFSVVEPRSSACPKSLGAHCVRLSDRLSAAHHQSRTSDGRAHPALSGLGRRPHQRYRIRNRPGAPHRSSGRGVRGG